jgi:hypothetical protein
MNARSMSHSPRSTRRVLLLSSFAALFSVGCLHTRTPSVATNAPAPAFTLSDSAGKQVSLAELTAHGPAVVTFYRGYW